MTLGWPCTGWRITCRVLVPPGDGILCVTHSVLWLLLINNEIVAVLNAALWKTCSNPSNLLAKIKTAIKETYLLPQNLANYTYKRLFSHIKSLSTSDTWPEFSQIVETPMWTKLGRAVACLVHPTSQCITTQSLELLRLKWLIFIIPSNKLKWFKNITGNANDKCFKWCAA